MLIYLPTGRMELTKGQLMVTIGAIRVSIKRLNQTTQIKGPGGGCVSPRGQVPAEHQSGGH